LRSVQRLSFSATTDPRYNEPMIIGDKATRTKAIPYEALPFDEYDLNYLNGVLGSVAQVVPIRLTRPHGAEVVEAYLSLQLTAAAASGFTARLMIGRFSDSNLTASSSYTEAEIAAGHLKLTGASTAFSVSAGGTLYIDDLNLLPGIPQPGDTDYNDDGFVLVIVFGSAPAITSGYNLDAFRVTCSAQMGLL